ncbi:MAG: hypothetical protein ACOZCO_04740 [Bacteroidota bacterium]
MKQVFHSAEKTASAETGTGTIIAWIIFSVVVVTILFFAVKKWRGR